MQHCLFWKALMVITARNRRMAKVIFSVCSHLGVPQPCPDEGTPARSGWGYPYPGMGYSTSQVRTGRGTPSRDLVPPPGIGQQMEYLICGGQYASCGRAGGLSCVYHHTEKVGKKQKECWCWNKLFDLLSELPQVASSADCRKQSSFSQLIKSWQCCQHRHQNKQKIRKSLAWPQEAYSPLRSKCSICCTLGGGELPQSQPGTPILTWPGGLPQFSPGWGVHLSWSTSPPRTGLFPGWDWGSPQHWDRGTPKKGPGTRDLEKNLEMRLPLERTWDQTPGKEPGTGVPPVNGHTPVKTFLPHPLDAGGNKLSLSDDYWFKSQMLSLNQGSSDRHPLEVTFSCCWKKSLMPILKTLSDWCQLQ